MKKLFAIIIIGLLIFHKQLNLELVYLLPIAAILALISCYKMKEGFDNGETNNEMRRRGPYSINNNVNSPGVVYANYTGTPDQYYYTGYPGYDDWTKGMRIDPNGNIWTVSNLGVDGDARVKGSHDVDHDASIKGVVSVGNNINCDKNVYAKGSGNFNNGLNVNGLTKLNDNVNVGGNQRIKGALGVDGNLMVNGNFGVNGVGTFRDNLGVVGSGRYKGDLTVDGHFSVGNGVGSGQIQEVEMADNGWGQVIDKTCPANSYLCGLRIRHEDKQESKLDNAGVNGIAMKCCSFK